MSDAVLAIALADIRPACKGEADLTKRVEKAMRAAQDFWMSTDDNLRFQGAVGAALLESPPEDKARLERSVQAAKSLAALLSGVPVDLESLAATASDVVPLQRMWANIKKERAA